MNFKSDIEMITRMYETMAFQKEMAQKKINDWNKYKNGKIYAIRSQKTDKYYIGSTTQPLHKRLGDHNSNFINSPHKYITSFEIIKYGDHFIELLENFPCETKLQLHKREGELTRKYSDQIVNKVVAGRSKSDYYYEKNHDILQNKKQYYLHNEDLIRKKVKKYREENPSKITETAQKYRETSKELIAIRQKEYRENNILELRCKSNMYYHQNKEVIHEKNKVKIICECGSLINAAERSRHIKSTCHQNFINDIIVKKVNRTDMIKCDCGTAIRHADMSRHKRSQKHQDFMTSTTCQV